MEIERKFLLSKFPHTELNLLSAHEVEQGYLSVNPEVRIRTKKPCKPGQEYTLVIKSDGHLSREEIEFELTAEQYDKLRAMIPFQLITKLYQRYMLPDGLVAECSVVDLGLESSFMYAEVEFESEGQALQFDPPACFGEEITYEESYKMKNYWTRRNEPSIMAEQKYWKRVCEMQKAQTDKGISKYGQILEQNTKLTPIERVTYLQEELVDALMYCEHLKEFIHNKEDK
jgi:CYTH domain-containing protein